MVVEALALYISMTLAVDCCFCDVIFESDSELLTRHMNSDMEVHRTYLVTLLRG